MTGEELRPVPRASAVLSVLAGSVPLDIIEGRIADATLLARRLTRGAGFSPDSRSVHPELADAITASVVRSLLNPSLPLAVASAPLSADPGSFAAWSETESALLTRLRDTGVHR